MTIQHTTYDTATLLGVFKELAPVSTFWLDLAFSGGALTFDDEYIDFSKIDENRLLAPLVVPTAQGRPMYQAAERTFRVKPAYLKPKDAIMASGMQRKTAGLGELLSAQPMSPQQRYDATLMDIARKHRDGIVRHWDKMAADAILYGAVTLESDSYPTAVVDFGRDAGHTVTLTGGTLWGASGVEPLDDLESWLNTVHQAKFGGPVNRLIMGTKAWAVFSQNERVKELLKTDLRQTSGTSLDLGLGDGTNVQYKGRVSQNLEVWVYSDYYELADGTTVPLMDSRDILLIGPNVRGVQCFGAILDKKAGFASTPIFPTMWDENDPSATILMTQSAPLPVPVNPNNTFRARVVA
jgi:hypothetical protein